MLTPKNNFSREASIGPVPSHWLHPALIGGWREAGGEAGREAGREVEKEAGREAGGEAERKARREAGGEAGAGMQAGKTYFVRLSSRRQLCQTELPKTELC